MEDVERIEEDVTVLEAAGGAGVEDGVVAEGVTGRGTWDALGGRPMPGGRAAGAALVTGAFGAGAAGLSQDEKKSSSAASGAGVEDSAAGAPSIWIPCGNLSKIKIKTVPCKSEFFRMRNINMRTG